MTDYRARRHPRVTLHSWLTDGTTKSTKDTKNTKKATKIRALF